MYSKHSDQTGQMPKLIRVFAGCSFLGLVMSQIISILTFSGLYRLDRLTSGVFIMAKTSDTAARIFKDIEQRRVQKEYVARVVGQFPE